MRAGSTPAARIGERETVDNTAGPGCTHTHARQPEYAGKHNLGTETIHDSQTGSIISSVHGVLCNITSQDKPSHGMRLKVTGRFPHKALPKVETMPPKPDPLQITPRKKDRCQGRLYGQ
ncbi:hypothetical protein CIHG_02575 [Coccidioides immitis H538.4]|uniref:Uncharacterized protein n=1 Tax=Coccidioides immitis H538.4 TaxID=396776 RepID=A0A0J8RJF0_COCIT|nr:hypothetical protein CIHG_02575 [Coccidioides immitis H538.4]